ncbi:MAG: hypothetical protein O3A60_10885, partial [Planctomycetota bacterium]|nr:hypothetical protein [Planctomycetota bacterium]
ARSRRCGDGRAAGDPRLRGRTRLVSREPERHTDRCPSLGMIPGPQPGKAPLPAASVDGEKEQPR